MAVDCLSRLMTGDYPLDRFIWAIRGAEQLDDPSAEDEASELVASLYRGVLDDGERGGVQAHELHPGVSRRACRVRPRCSHGAGRTHDGPHTAHDRPLYPVLP